jgi:hypothetical protein
MPGRPGTDRRPQVPYRDSDPGHRNSVGHRLLATQRKRTCAPLRAYPRSLSSRGAGFARIVGSAAL